MNSKKALEAAILANPRDKVSLLAYADLLEEGGNDDLSYAYRWLARWKKHPLRCEPGVGWCWATGGGYYGLCHTLAFYLRGYRERLGFDSIAYGRCYYATLPGAVKGLAEALKRLRGEVGI